MFSQRVIKGLFLLLVTFSLISLAVKFTQAPFKRFLGLEEKSGIKITSQPEAEVLINGHQVGTTPFSSENLSPGDYQVKLVKENLIWQSNVKLTAGTITAITRDLSAKPDASAGEVVTLFPGQGLVVLSNPPTAEVSLDNQVKGLTPLTLDDISIGEHNIIIKHIGFVARSIRMVLPDKVQMVINADLAGSDESLDVSIPKVIVLPKVVVLSTPTGFLRVRDKPNLGGIEVARVNPGDTLDLLEEDKTSGWDKVRLPDNKEGYVSSSYVQLKN